MNLKTIVLDKNCSLVLYSEFYNLEKSISLYNSILKHNKWTQGEISMFGKKIKEPRLTAFFSDQGVEYKYSGRLNKGQFWTKKISIIKTDIESLARTKFNSVLLNYYRDQQDSMGWHRDNEKELGIEPVIASLSLGQERTFWIRRYANKTETQKINLPSGSLLLMLGRTQQDWEHCIKKQSHLLEGRINLTFRNVIV
jgi:alkylated DNA repair dioxygenase AlkB